MMLACSECGKKFPVHLVQLMITPRGDFMVCPICALKIRNEVHGLNDKKFQGERANALLKEAKAYLKKKEKSNERQTN